MLYLILDEYLDLLIFFLILSSISPEYLIKLFYYQLNKYQFLSISNQLKVALFTQTYLIIFIQRRWVFYSLIAFFISVLISLSRYYLYHIYHYLPINIFINELFSYIISSSSIHSFIIGIIKVKFVTAVYGTY